MLRESSSGAGLEETAAAIASVQLSSGCIPHFPGGIADPWNHTEAAMALDVSGRHEVAEAAYRWLASTQRAHGAWAAAYEDDEAVDATLDANFTAYIATGLWHHYLATRNEFFLEEMWAVVERAIGFTLDLQDQTGAVLWARDASFDAWPGALLTSSSCIHLSLRCAIAIGETLGEERPDWELSLASLADAIATRQDAFESKDRFSMDWYYPVLGGIVTGADAHTRLASRWSEFVIEGRGARCVSDRPWVTSGETSELILALDAAGLADQAAEVFEWLQHLRTEGGAYWIGATFPNGIVWPRQKPTWGSGAVILAADALGRTSDTSGLFRGDSFPDALDAQVADPL